MVDIGDAFPSFELPDQDGRVRTNSELIDKQTIIYFYPKDDTSGCTQEACEFQNNLQHFAHANVVGVSPDSVKSHRKFATKYSLDFVLLSDEAHALCEACGVWVEKSMYGKKYMGVERSTFLVDADGKITKVWRKVKAAGHAEEVLNSIR